VSTIPSSKIERIEKSKQSERNIKQELIDAGLEILAEEGLEKLTLRKVAARVGVSHAAPAHHFTGLPQLLGCICAVGFQRLTKTMQDRRATAPDTPRDRLVAMCEGYIDFALSNPGMVHLMFNTGKQAVDDTKMQPEGAKAYKQLAEACAPFEPVSSEPDSTESLVWSLVHGLAFLRIGGRFENPNRQTSEPVIAAILPNLKLKNT